MIVTGNSVVADGSSVLATDSGVRVVGAEVVVVAIVVEVDVIEDFVVEMDGFLVLRGVTMRAVPFLVTGLLVVEYFRGPVRSYFVS